VDGPRTHYQISLTARQAMGLFVALLLGLALAFFFGLMTGLSGRGPAGEAGHPVAGASGEPASEPAPPLETGAKAAESTFSGASRTLLAPAEGPASSPEPSPPPTLQSFDDGQAEGPPGGSPAPEASSPPPEAAASRAPGAGAGSVWVQVASLSSREEASALRGRLVRRGFPARVLAAAGPKGHVYRVRVGPYPSEAEAARAAARLAKQERIKEPWIVPEGK
jgi:cell division septation protein DedD